MIPSPASVASDYSARARIECDEDSLRDAFPTAGQEAGITETVVRVRVTIDATGRVTGASAIEDPGFGFAAAAIRALQDSAVCRIRPARDREGRPVGDTVPSFRFNFVAEN